MGGGIIAITTAVLLILLQIATTKAELTPPYFNLAEGRKITATATCGVDTDEPELYCKLVGANTENEESFYSLIQGQVCDYCNSSDPKKTHPVEYAIDGTENWWQSPPLSRGMKYNEVNLTIDFGQEFHVAYIFIRMGNSPRPGLWTLEKSNDYGKTWTPWQHFSDSTADCEIFFGKESLKPIKKDDDVICTTEYSKIVPLENGEIPVMLLNNRPSANNYFNSTVLQEWTRATNVRIRLLRTKNLLGHLMSVARQDPTVTRRYFYSIKDISIGGRCMCNGHANTCIDMPRSNQTTRLLACQCHHNTCGMQCESCCPGFEQKKWRQNTNARPFQCEPCNCHGHSNECIYSEEIDALGKSLDIHGNYEGGGVCQNCRDNTEGINCNKCKDRFYRPYGKYWNETEVCQPCNCDYFYSTGNCEEETGQCECRVEFQAPNCDSCAEGYFGYPNCRPCECNLNGTTGYHCEATDGKCPCKENFGGDFCKECSEGYFNYPECVACECNMIGSIGEACDDTTGQCECKNNYAGKHCDQCKNNYYNYPECAYCNCDLAGTEEEVCDKVTGQCICKEGYGGPRCDQCVPRYYGFPNCIPCNCSAAGSVLDVCDQTGKCPCYNNFAGKQCTTCAPGFYQYPECLACNCDSHGSRGKSCNNEGQCNCDHNFDGKTCGMCKEGFYNFPACEECNCDPAGVIPKFAGCGSVPAGELCQCKERVQGRICDKCRPLYWNLTSSNPHGCEECDCHIDGTIGGLDTCDTKSGQCSCKPHVQGRQCMECKDGTFDLFGSSLFGCKDCGCDVGGSASEVCNKNTGQCNCHPRIAGRTCTRPLTTHYFPTLYQFKFEYEDGYTSTGAQVRYQFDEDIFPGFSKIGYAVFSPLQNEIYNDVDILKSSVYRLIIRYINPNSESVVGNILIQSDDPLQSDQTSKVLFKPNRDPEFVTMAGLKGEIPSPVVLDPGRYTIIISSEKSLFLDYFVLLPDAYYEAAILSKKVVNPCEIGRNDLCRHYKYPSIADYTPIYEAYVLKDGDESYKADVFYDDTEHLEALGEGKMPLINDKQQELRYVMDVPRYGRYVLVIDYITNKDFVDMAILNVNQEKESEQDGAATIYPCLYTTVCRQIVIDKEAREKVFFIEPEDLNPIILSGDTDGVVIKSVTAIPYDSWTVDFIYPRPVCMMVDGECVRSTFVSAPDSKKIEFELENEESVNSTLDIIDKSVKVIYLDRNNSEITIKSKVPDPGQYVIILKYYQPNHPNFYVNYRLETAKQNYNGKLYLGHCPSNSGCRVQLTQTKGLTLFDIEDEFTFTLVSDDSRGVWLDYALWVPVAQFHENLLREEDFDQTKEFIKQCGQDSFNIQLNASEFCKQSVFSLTADYNRGALPCSCDYHGSTSFECEPFGGQCQCKANIIGRQCEACKTSYYGFPDCKPCDCPSTAVCEKETGECICPPKVTGEKCDQCVPYTFGFDQIIGCEDCGCNPMGVENGNLQCDLYNGSCECKPNVVGRICDKCAFGFFKFPYCDACRCDLRGTTLEICDQDDEICFCKKNVIGQECNQCKEGTYNLQEKNPEGCTKCFCFGKTTRCESAYLRPFNVSMMNEVTLHTISTNGSFNNVKWLVADDSIMLNDTTAQVHLIEVDNPELLSGNVYFGMLDNLGDLHDHISCYGEYLSYTIFYTTSFFGSATIAPDIILEGKDLTIVHINYEQPASSVNFYGSVQMIERNFQTISGASVTREQFMMVLRDLKKIYIRASYFDQGVLTLVSDVSLTLANDDPENYHLYEELSMERCECPPGYTGFSCQDCDVGYYRIKDGPYGGYCVPCECNGHARACDCDTGICLDCQHSTTGDHCEQCIEGYYGNATNKTPNDCMICACPLPIDSNNFATGCEVSEDGTSIHCTCKEGYTGHKCQYCANGYFGTPEVPGETCKSCECSGNIDTDMPGACDSVTGECLKCLNNTYGQACNLCAPGFFGDAVGAKDCQSCICDNIGTNYCNNIDGTCVCLPNVIGEKCDRCANDHYGFESGIGCTPCDCAEASNSTQCDDHSGECACKFGVTGRQCDRCLPGYWDYPNCIPCSCNTDYSRGFGCNPLNGQCECLKDVVGERCDSCPPRWVFIDNYGCEECDGCHHALLDVTDNLTATIDPVIENFKTVAKSFYTTQKLKRLDQEANNLKPEVEKLDPNAVNLSQQHKEIDTLDMDSKNLKKRATYSVQSAQEKVKDSEKLLKDATDLLDNNRLVANTAKVSIQEVNKLADNLESSEKGTKIDMAISEAEDYLDRIKNYQLSIVPIEPAFKLDSVLGDVDSFVQPINEQNDRLKALKEELTNFDSKLEDLYVWSDKSKQLSAQAEAVLKKNKESKLTSNFEKVANYSKEANKALADGDSYRKNASIVLLDTYGRFDDIGRLVDDMKTVNAEGDVFFPKVYNEYTLMEPKIEEIKAHAVKLSQKSQELTDQLSDISANTEQALLAATAYDKIVNAISEAENHKDDAQIAAKEAKDLTDGIEDKAGASDQFAGELLGDAKNSLKIVQQDLEPHLNTSATNVDDIETTNANSNNQLNSINLSLDLIKVDDSQTGVWTNAKEVAETAHQNAKEALEILAPITKEVEAASERAKKIPKEIDNVNKETVQTGKAIDKVVELVPKIITMAEKLEEKQNNLDIFGSSVGDGIEHLKKQIEFARDLANQIKLGVTFQPNTTLELKTPENLSTMQTNTKVSTYFKTRNPNGLVYYLGSEDAQTGGPRSKRNNDYMAVEIENGYPVLTIDLGNGPERVINKKYVADDKWYEIIVDRSGNHVNLIVREETEDGSDQVIEEQKELEGTHSVFNIGPDSRLFVGGTDVNLPQDVKQSSFSGQMEEFKIGDQEVGLWNFVDAQNNNLGSIERDKLVTKHSPTTGYRFGGNGYVILDARPFNFKQRSNIEFKFKAARDSQDGLMFYAGKDHHFISIELKDGQVMFQFKMGEYSDIVTIGTDNQFNDDKWHKVEASRAAGAGQLKVDDQIIFQESGFNPQGQENVLKISDRFYFGGHPDQISHPEVSNKNFDGCIDEVFIMGTPVDLSSNERAFDVRPGCPTKFSSVLSYTAGQNGYLRKGNLTTPNRAQINLKFKTKQKEGIVFYGMNHDQSSTISLAMLDGILVLRSSTQELNTGNNRYDNGEWHVVTATHDEKKLRLSIDDIDHFVSDESPPTLQIKYGDIYFGGFPRNFQPIRGAIATTAYFTGCISDVTINGQVVNFANSTDKHNAVLTGCSRDIFEYDPSVIPISYPDGDEKPIVDVRTPFQSETVPKGKEPTEEDDSFNEIEGIDGDIEDKIPVVSEVPLVPITQVIEVTTTEATTTTTTSTTTEATTTTTPEPTTVAPTRRTKPTTQPRITTKRPLKPDQICRLPKNPEYTEFDSGLRFGTSQDSRIEYTIPTKIIKREYDFRFEMKTSQPNGLLFYASNPERKDVIALYLKDGYVHYVFNCGGPKSVEIVSTDTYNDGEYHNIEFTRSHNKGSLTIDGADITKGELSSSAKTMEITSPTYIGGFDPEIAEEILSKLNLERSFLSEPFAGCISDIELNKTLIDNYGFKFTKTGVLPCAEDVEDGVFFQGGLLKLRERFVVGQDLAITMDIKPRTETGILLSVHGKKAFFIIQLLNGTVVFSVDSGTGPINTVYKPDDDENLCDGNWHTIKAIKSAYVVTVTVDNRSSEPAIGNEASLVTQTSRPLFVGGHPHIQKIRGLLARKPFYGCMRNIKINNVPEQINYSMINGDVQLGTCPLN